jgi:DNA polymerase-3 subunit delta
MGAKTAPYANRGEDPGILLQKLASGPLLPVYLLFGEEGYLVERAVKTVLGRMGGTAPGVRLRAGDDRLVDRLEQTLRMSPLFGGQPCAMVTEVESLSDAAQEEILALLLRDLGGHLLLVGATPDMRRRLYSRCMREGWAFGFRRLPLARIPAWLREEAAQRGHVLAAGAVERLTELVGSDLRTAAAEIEKISLYVGAGQPIGLDAVAAVVGAMRARSVLELATLIERRDLGPALALVRRLLGQGEPPVALAAFLAAQVRRMLIVKSLASGPTAPAEIAGRLGVQPWLADRIMSGARRYEAVTLERALAQLAALDFALKSSRLPAVLLFESCLLELASGASPTQRG